MTGNLRDYFCTSTDIAKAWGVEEREIKNQANRISRKFKDILEQMDFSEEDISFYKNKHITYGNSNSAMKPDSKIPEGRSYIFRDFYNAPDQLKRLFQIFKKTKTIMTEKDRDEVKEILVNILPVYCGVEDMELSNEQDSLFQLHELNRLLREINIPELIEYFQKNKQIVKICNKIQGITEELNTILTNDLDAAAWLDRGRDYYRRKYEVERKVDAYYINNLQKGYFEDNIFVHAKQCGDSWKDIYKVQYHLIKKWSDKWASIIDKVKELKRTENFGIKVKLQEYINRLEGEEEYLIEGSKVRLTNEQTALEQCGDLVAYICAKCESELKQHCREEYDYIKVKAFKELTSIGRRVEEEQDAHCSSINVK